MTLGLIAIAFFVAAGGIFAFGIVRIFRTQRPQWRLQMVGWSVWTVGLLFFLVGLMT